MASAMQSTSQNEELCLVCNDISTGYHYGVPSCNGCKTFFRRTIMKSQKFICQYEGKCMVDKSIRCGCRHCRFEKCLRVGMDRNAIQANRDPIGYTKRTRRYPPIKKGDGGSEECERDMTLQNVQTPSPQIFENVHDRFLQLLTDIERKSTALLLSEYFPIRNLVEAVTQPCLLIDDEFMNEYAIPSPRHTIGTLRRATREDYHYWHERLWFVMIEWAKSIPSFQTLPFDDKLALLRHSAVSYACLVQVYTTPNHGPDTIVFPDGSFFDRTPEYFRPPVFNRKKYQMLDQLLKPMRDMHIDLLEFSAFKAIFFLNPEAIEDVDSPSKKLLTEERTALTMALYRYVIRKGGDDGAERFSRLLLMGSIVSSMCVETKEAVLLADFFDQIHFSTHAKQLLFGIKDEPIPSV